jgi:uncharacterized protein YggT (Ycf19 family)
MQDRDLTHAEAHEASRLTAVKEMVGGRVNAEIESEAAVSDADDRAQVESVAKSLRAEAIDDTVRQDRAIGRARVAARGSQFLDYAFCVLYSLLGIRLVLSLMAARPDNGFVQFIAAITDPFYAPFKGIVASPATEAGHTLVLPLIVAMVVYFMVHMGINGILRMVGNRKTAI